MICIGSDFIDENGVYGFQPFKVGAHSGAIAVAAVKRTLAREDKRPYAIYRIFGDHTLDDLWNISTSEELASRHKFELLWCDRPMMAAALYDDMR